MKKNDKPLFRAGEILDMAVQVEEKGLSFYRACRQARSHEPGIREVLDYLIKQENRHRDTFRRMKSGLEERPLRESYPGEMQSYLESFVKDRVFYETEKAIEEISHMNDFSQAVEFGIRFEKLSIDFYKTIKDRVRSSEHGSIEAIIHEEREHIRRLLALRRSLEHGR